MGFTESRIATRMGPIPNHCQYVRQAIRSKLQVTNKAELIRKAIKLGYLDADQRDLVA
jgi:DNA-binding NarL/FixJ family response regulator